MPGDCAILEMGLDLYSSTMKFDADDFSIELEASGNDGIDYEVIQVRLCTDGLCNVFGVKPEAGCVIINIIRLNT